jgi:hypothetical protein
MTADPSLTALYSSLDPVLKSKIKNKIHDYATSDSQTITVPNPLSPYKTDTMEMTPLQWMSTYDEQFKKQNPEYAALNAYYNPYQSNRSFGYAMGEKLNNLYKGYGPVIGDILNKGPLAGGLLTMAPGLLLGAAGTGLMNLITGNSLSNNVLRNALIGGLASGSLGAYSGYLRKYKPQWAEAKIGEPERWTPEDLNKINLINRAQAMAGLNKQSATTKSAFMGGAADDQARVVQLIQAAPGLSFNEKSQLIAGVAQLSSNEVSQLSDSLIGFGGAAVGAIVARFLMNKGLIGTVLGAIFGGTVARSLFGAPVPKNDLGQPSFQGRTLLGQYL